MVPRLSTSQPVTKFDYVLFWMIANKILRSQLPSYHLWSSSSPSQALHGAGTDAAGSSPQDHFSTVISMVNCYSKNWLLLTAGRDAAELQS